MTASPTPATSQLSRQPMAAISTGPSGRKVPSPSEWPSVAMLAAGAVGVAMRILGLPLLPAVLGVVLGFLVESNYRRSLVLSGGDHSIFMEDPVAVVLLSFAALFLVGSLMGRVFTATRGKPASGAG